MHVLTYLRTSTVYSLIRSLHMSCKHFMHICTYVGTYVCSISHYTATTCVYTLELFVCACVQESALARQSLYVKFDPLVGGNSPKRHLQGAALRPKAGYVQYVFL